MRVHCDDCGKDLGEFDCDGATLDQEITGTCPRCWDNQPTPKRTCEKCGAEAPELWYRTIMICDKCK